MRKSGLALVIDTRQLAENLRALRHSNEEAALVAYFVRHGASRAMLHQLFHLSHNAITRQRRRLGVRLGQGRPPLPDHATRDAIHRRWADLGRARERPAPASRSNCTTSSPPIRWWFSLRCSMNSTPHSANRTHHSGSQHV